MDTLQRVGLAAIVVGDRGVGRKEMIIRLVQHAHDLVLRLDPDITAFTPEHPAGIALATLLAARPWRGAGDGGRGAPGVWRGRLHLAHATIRFSRTGRTGDTQEALVTFVEVVPLDSRTDPLVVATTLPVDTLAQARAVVRIDAQRWCIETAVETMHAWGQDAFMVRRWVAIDRLLWVVAVASALVVLALIQPMLRPVRAQATALLKLLAVLGRRLTVGKLAAAIGLNDRRHRRAWTVAWLT